MSYYDNPQWSAPAQNNWDHHGASTPVRAGTLRALSNSVFDMGAATNELMSIGANGPQPQDDYAFSYQFDGTYRRMVAFPTPGATTLQLFEYPFFSFLGCCHECAASATPAASDIREFWKF